MALVAIVLLILFIFLIGVLGFRALFDEEWIDAVYYAATTTATVALVPSNKIVHSYQKVFISVYVFLASCVFLVAAGYVVQLFLVRSHGNKVLFPMYGKIPYTSL